MNLENSLVLGRYRVLWCLEQRGSVASYIARDEDDHNFLAPVLVQQFRPALKEGERNHKLFQSLKRLTGVRHPGVVPMLDFGTLEGSVIVALEHQRGVDFDTLLKDFEGRGTALDPAWALLVVDQVLGTLEHCHNGHAEPLVHGRITPNAIYVTRKGLARLRNFGLAYFEGLVSEAGEQLGPESLSYSAPETAQRGLLSPSSDVYSLALVCYRAVAGKNPLVGDSAVATLNNILRRAVPAFDGAHWQSAVEVNEALARALGKDPGARFQTAAQLRAALRRGLPSDVEPLREQLSACVQERFAADWGQIARVTREVRRAPSSHEPVPGHSASGREWSRSFTSGLHGPAASVSGPAATPLPTQRALRLGLPSGASAAGVASRGPRRAVVGTLTGALALACGALIWLSVQRYQPPLEAPTLAQPLPSTPSVQLQSPVLQRLYRECLQGGPAAVVQLEIELSDDSGISRVRLSPPAVAESRCGARLLRKAWDTDYGVVGRAHLAIVLDPAEPPPASLPMPTLVEP